VTQIRVIRGNLRLYVIREIRGSSVIREIRG
jgi:hypothetical protein